VAAATEHCRIVLKHPPLPELSDFNDLTAQLQALAAERDAASNQLHAFQAHIRQLNSVGRRSRAQALDLKQSKQAESQAKTLLASLGQQIKDCQNRLAAFPNSKKYSIDCLALDTGWLSGGLFVFDCGSPAR
jgi:hypothetical protein